MPNTWDLPCVISKKCDKPCSGVEPATDSTIIGLPLSCDPTTIALLFSTNVNFCVGYSGIRFRSAWGQSGVKGGQSGFWRTHGHGDGNGIYFLALRSMCRENLACSTVALMHMISPKSLKRISSLPDATHNLPLETHYTLLYSM